MNVDHRHVAVSHRMGKSSITLAVVAGLTCFVPANAEVEIVAVSFESGRETVVGSGELDNVPVMLNPLSEVLIDRCGSIYRWQDGKTEITAWEPARSAEKYVLQGLERFPVGSSSAGLVGVFEDGRPRTVSLDFIARHPYTSKQRALDIPDWPSDVHAEFVMYNKQMWIIDAEGNLHWADGSPKRGFKLQQASEKGVWKNTVAATLELVGRQVEGRKAQDVHLYTIDKAGNLLHAMLGTFGQRNTALRPDPDLKAELIGQGVFPETVSLLSHSPDLKYGEKSEAEGWYRLDSAGRVFQVDLRTGEQTERGQLKGLAGPGTFVSHPSRDRFDDRYDFLYARTKGDAAYADCPNRAKMLADEQALKVAEAAGAEAKVQHAAEKREADADAHSASWAGLEDLYEKHKDEFEKKSEHGFKTRWDIKPDTLLSAVDKILANLDAFHKANVQPATEALDAHISAYGDGRPSRGSRMSIDVIDALQEYVDHANEIKKAYAVTLAKEADIILDLAKPAIEAMDKKETNERLQKSQRCAVAALQYDPENKQARELAKTVPQTLKTFNDQWAERVEKTAWPHHWERFKGPGDVDKLASEAMAFVNHSEGTDFFASYVSGDWRRNQKNALGEVTDFMINFWMVRPDPEDSSLGILADVALVTTKAQESSPYRTAFIQVKGRVALSKKPH